MSDSKKPEADKAATGAGEAETISDDALQNVEGGWSWGVSKNRVKQESGGKGYIEGSGGSMVEGPGTKNMERVFDDE